MKEGLDALVSAEEDELEENPQNRQDNPSSKDSTIFLYFKKVTGLRLYKLLKMIDSSEDWANNRGTSKKVDQERPQSSKK